MSKKSISQKNERRSVFSVDVYPGLIRELRHVCSVSACANGECAHPGALEASVICQGSSLPAKRGAPRVRGRASPLPGWATPLPPGVPTLPPGPPTCALAAARRPSPPRGSRLPAPGSAPRARPPHPCCPPPRRPQPRVQTGSRDSSGCSESRAPLATPDWLSSCQ